MQTVPGTMGQRRGRVGLHISGDGCGGQDSSRAIVVTAGTGGPTEDEEHPMQANPSVCLCAHATILKMFN